MFRIVIKKGRSLKIGLNSYTYEEALNAQERLKNVGINALVLSEDECFN